MALRLAPRAMEADRGMIRKQAPPDVTLRSGGEGNATPARIAAPNVMACNAPPCNRCVDEEKKKIIDPQEMEIVLEKKRIGTSETKKND